MKYRKLRIAFSVGCGVFSLFLLALWARSNHKAHWLNLPAPNDKHVTFATYAGVLAVSLNNQPSPWDIGTSPVPPGVAKAVNSMLTLGFGISPTGNTLFVVLWIPISISAILAAVPWMSWRFSTRALLIATTLIAVLLGFISALMRLRP
jgi:hypothetical protein